jgi:hypothetical protein
VKAATIFVTYNPKNDFEQTLAIRLQTIAGVHGFNMSLPDRHHGDGKVSMETAFRIRNADYFILFSTSRLTSVVQEEVKMAFDHLKDKSRILIIYNKVKNLKHSANCTEVFIDAKKDSPQEILEKVIGEVKRNQKTLKRPATQKKVAADDTASALGGLLLVGLGLLALGSLVNTGKK